MTPVVRHDYRLGVPGTDRYEEILNTDAALYGGGNVGNQGGVEVRGEPAQEFPASVVLTLPPLATIYLRPAG